MILELLKEKDIRENLTHFPLVLIDIGASGGIKDHWKPLGDCLRVIGFEPDERAFRELMQSPASGITYLNTALQRRKENQEFFLTRKQQVSSIFRPDMAFLKRFPEWERFEILSSISLHTDTLDNQLGQNGIKDVDFIKLDTQGSELFILQGADDALKSTVLGIEIEVEFTALYENQPLFADVDAFMRERGYMLFDLRPCYWKRTVGRECMNAKGQLVFADAVYLRDIEHISSILELHKDDAWRRAKVMKAVAVCILYHHHDYAREICEHYKQIFSAAEYAVLDAEVMRRSRSGRYLAQAIPAFPGRGRLADLIYNLWKLMQPKYWRSVLYLEDGQRLEKY